MNIYFSNIQRVIKFATLTSFQNYLTAYSTLIQGTGFDKRIFLLNEKQEKISFWNDIPLKKKESAVDEYTFCIEIPINQLAKMEVCKEEIFHPIKQDTQKNKFDKSKTELRYYAQFPLFHYGFLPQTWENNLEKTQEGFFGDNDPLDVVDLSDAQKKIADIYQVKVLGCFCLIDQGEVDWKILSICKDEAIKKKIFSLRDIEKLYPGRLEAIKNWFRFIKTFQGKKENQIHYNGQLFEQDKAIEVIQEMNSFWKELKLQQNKSKSQEYANLIQERRKLFKFSQNNQ